LPPPLFPYTTLFRSSPQRRLRVPAQRRRPATARRGGARRRPRRRPGVSVDHRAPAASLLEDPAPGGPPAARATHRTGGGSPRGGGERADEHRDSRRAVRPPSDGEDPHLAPDDQGRGPQSGGAGGVGLGDGTDGVLKARRPTWTRAQRLAIRNTG